jgi:hypothetical protein
VRNVQKEHAATLEQCFRWICEPVYPGWFVENAGFFPEYRNMKLCGNIMTPLPVRSRMLMDDINIWAKNILRDTATRPENP